MATTIDSPTIDHKLDEAHRTNRWLIAAVVVLAIALVALGAWVISDLTTSSTAEPPAEVQALLADYNASWNVYDGDAFLGTVGDGYRFFDGSPGTQNAESTAATVERGALGGFTTEAAGDYVFVVNRDGDQYVAFSGPIFQLLSKYRFVVHIVGVGGDRGDAVRQPKHAESLWLSVRCALDHVDHHFRGMFSVDDNRGVERVTLARALM